jgi:hypothetical protein
MIRDRLLTALMGSKPVLTNDEIAEQQVREWRQEAAKATQDVISRMRRHLDVKSAATAGRVGHHELSQATTERLALWADQEQSMLTEVRGHDLAEEARRWVLRRLERGRADAADPLPKLAVYGVAVQKLAEGVFCDHNDDAIFRECLHQAIVESAKAVPAAKPQKAVKVGGNAAEPTKKSKGHKAGVNARMLETIQKDLAQVSGWTAQQWARHLKCAASSVVKTQCWTDLSMGRERLKAERAKDRRRRPKGSDLKRG